MKQDHVDLEQDLPDGCCFSRFTTVEVIEQTPMLEMKSTIRKCAYIGSFPVVGEDHNSRAEFVRKQLEQVKDRVSKKPVLLVISLTGIKVCNVDDGKSVLMAHALRRISFATCDPQSNQFSFLAREPNGHFNHQYCHSFVTGNAGKAEELSRVVGSAFRMAYAQQLAQPLSVSTPVANDSHGERARSSLAPRTVLLRSTCRTEVLDSKAIPPTRLCWAKKLAGKTKYPDPMSEQAIEMSMKSKIPSTSSNNPCNENGGSKKINSTNENGIIKENASCMKNGSCMKNVSTKKNCTAKKNGNTKEHGSTEGKSSSPPPIMNHFSERAQCSNDLHDFWSPGCSSSSSEENNSPTELNSCKQIKDKPLMCKNLEVVQEGACADDILLQLPPRPLSGGYINDEASWGMIPNLRVTLTETPKQELRNYSSCKVNKCTMTGSDSPPPYSRSDLSSPPYPNSDQNPPPYSSSTPETQREENVVEASKGAKSKRSVCTPHKHRSSSSSSCSSDTTDVGRRSRSASHSNGASCSLPCSTPPPPLPERHDSLSSALNEERELMLAPWFQAGIPREIALEVLCKEPIGSFMVRQSTSKPGCFALSLRVPREFHASGIAHYLIMRTNRGYKIKGFMKEFLSMTALITHHSVMPELLPCTLSLTRHNPTFKRNDSDMVDVDDDPDYNMLSDFRKKFDDNNDDDDSS